MSDSLEECQNRAEWWKSWADEAADLLVVISKRSRSKPTRESIAQILNTYLQICEAGGEYAVIESEAQDGD